MHDGGDAEADEPRVIVERAQRRDKAQRLVQVLARDTVDVRQPINAVYYRNTQLATRIACFLDFLAERLGGA